MAGLVNFWWLTTHCGDSQNSSSLMGSTKYAETQPVTDLKLNFYEPNATTSIHNMSEFTSPSSFHNTLAPVYHCLVIY